MSFLYAFDLLELNGAALRREPIEVCKATLASILRKARHGVRLNCPVPSAAARAIGPLPLAFGWYNEASLLGHPLCGDPKLHQPTHRHSQLVERN